MTYFLQKLVGNLCDPDAVSAANEELAAIRAMSAENVRLAKIVEAAKITRRRFGPEWAAPFTELDEALQAPGAAHVLPKSGDST